MGGERLHLPKTRDLKLYDFVTGTYFTAIKLAALWNQKAALATKGRKHIFSNLTEKITAQDRVIWVHCSSAGELEQAKPVIEDLKEKLPAYKILLTLFSPSGIAAAKKYSVADVVSFLPFDNRSNAEKFIAVAHPSLAIFVKYEFWYHHLHAAAFRHIPILLVSASFRPGQVFFRKYGRFYRQMLFFFRHIFVQDESSRELLQQSGISHCSVAGDTRFDRVMHLPNATFSSWVIDAFVGDQPMIVAGSTWRGDERILAEYVNQHPAVNLIIAPHEVSNHHVARLEKMFNSAVRYSSFKILETKTANKNIWEQIETKEKRYHQSTLQQKQVLIVDNVGMLSLLYRYATIAYVGGGFTRDGIHNILEAAVYQRPVIIGPNYKKYPEANGLIAAGGAFSISNGNELRDKISALLKDQQQLKVAGQASGQFVQSNKGATEKIVDYIQANRLLTN